MPLPGRAKRTTMNEGEQLGSVAASFCGTGGHGFEPRKAPPSPPVIQRGAFRRLVRRTQPHRWVG